MLAAAVFAAATAATVNELQCSDSACTKCNVAQNWVEGECYGVGNAPPYHTSQKVVMSGGVATLSNFKGDSCAGEAASTDPNPIGKCVYFTAQIWTVFKEAALAAPAAGTVNELQCRDDAAIVWGVPGTASAGGGRVSEP